MASKPLILQMLLWKYVGTPYRWGGDDPTSFDCSGLVIECLKSVGMLPANYDNTAQGLYYLFEPKGISSEKKTGSIVFYGPSINEIKHVAMFIDDEHVIEAGGGGSKTNTMQDAIDQNAFVRVRPWNARGDACAIVRPKYEEGV